MFPRTFVFAALLSVASAIPVAGGLEYDVIILGGGVAGVIAAQQLHQAGITNYVIVEARDELGGRMRPYQLGDYSLEVGCNWVQGTQSSTGGRINPIYKLAKKHKLKTVENNWDDLQFYDHTGQHDFRDIFSKSEKHYSAMINAAGSRIETRQVDLNARSGYMLVGSRPSNQYEWASEYFNFDWEYAQSPEQSSWIGSSFNHNFTFDPKRGGFADDNLMSVDERGFSHILLDEAATFLRPNQVKLSSYVNKVNYDQTSVNVRLQSGEILRGKYALVTFSVGVLQHPEDVAFSPPLPSWKREAIDTMSMGTYTKIFLKWDTKFWDDHEMGIYADPYKRGYYPVWQNLDHPKFFPGSGIYFVTVTGDESKRIESMPDDKVLEEVMGVLQNMYPDITVPRPTQMHFHRWYNDKLTRGSFANWPSSFYVEHQENLRAPVHRMFFAGEATSFRYYGYLQGAYTEGESAGKAIARCLQGGSCPTTGHDFLNNNRLVPEWYQFS